MLGWDPGPAGAHVADGHAVELQEPVQDLRQPHVRRRLRQEPRRAGTWPRTSPRRRRRQFAKKSYKKSYSSGEGPRADVLGQVAVALDRLKYKKKKKDTMTFTVDRSDRTALKALDLADACKVEFLTPCELPELGNPSWLTVPPPPRRGPHRGGGGGPGRRDSRAARPRGSPPRPGGRAPPRRVDGVDARRGDAGGGGGEWAAPLSQRGSLSRANARWSPLWQGPCPSCSLRQQRRADGR